MKKQVKNRRTFLKLAAAGVVLAGAGYSVVKLTSPFEKAIAAVLRKDLEGLKVKEEDIVAFSKMAAEQNPWHYGNKAQRLISLYSGVNVNFFPLPYKEQYKEYRTQITGRFLLSTDFFINKMDEQKEISFSGKLWAPYTMPCMNPFSNLFYPEV